MLYYYEQHYIIRSESLVIVPTKGRYVKVRDRSQSGQVQDKLPLRKVKLDIYEFI